MKKGIVKFDKQIWWKRLDNINGFDKMGERHDKLDRKKRMWKCNTPLPVGS